MMQLQLEVMDQKIEKIESEIGGSRREVENAESKIHGLEKSLAGVFFTKEDFDRFSDELKKKIGAWMKLGLLQKRLNDMQQMGLARLMIMQYILVGWGKGIVDHSEHLSSGKGGSSNWLISGKNNPRSIHPDAQRVLEPSFGEPGQCLPLDSSSGFVVVRLRTAIIPEAITLDHVAKIVAYDRCTAPKDCQVSGWYQEYDSVQQAGQVPKLFKLVEFVYDLDRSNSQTFNVDPSYSGVVKTVRLDFRSNHGADYTCLYRLRVHGREADAVAMSKL